MEQKIELIENPLLLKMQDTPPPVTDRERTLARLGVSLAFLVSGVGFAFWVSRIPTIRHDLHLSDKQLGLALLGTAVGALIGFPLAGAGCARYGSRAMSIAFGLGYCATLATIPFANSLLTLSAILLFLGICHGGMDVAINENGVAVERLYGRSIMSSLHGTYSLGNLLGASAGLLLVGHIATAPHLIGGAVLLVAILAWISRVMLFTKPTHKTGEPAFALPSRSLVAVGTIVTCAFLCEGAMGDWSGVYLRETLKTRPDFAVAGFVVYSTMMTLARFSGDKLLSRWGPTQVLRVAGTIAFLGFGLSLLVAQPVVALIGFGCVGLGMSTVAPIGFGMAGRATDRTPASAIAAVATMGYSGFLVGPPLIGLLAEAITLRGALGIVALLSLLIAILASRLDRSSIVSGT